MKIAWFTPFSTKSAIGKASRDITHYLNANHAVDLWLSEKTDLLSTPVNKIFYTQAKRIDFSLCQMLATYDFIIYNLGNNYNYHGAIYEVLKKYPGIVILHEYVNHHFFTGYYFLQNRKDEYVELMHQTYGPAGLDVATASVYGEALAIWQSPQVINYPLYEPLIANALGVVTHAKWAATIIQKHCTSPIKVINLPCPAAGKIVNSPVNEPTSTTAKIKLLTIGHVNANKCIHLVIEVIGKNKHLMPPLEYLIVGDTDSDAVYFKQLQDLIAQYSLESVVHFKGYQPDEILQSYIEQADICINLRFPAIEAASGSVLEEMYYGKALIVTDIGFYKELPSNTVLKIKPPNNELDIKEALNKLISHSRLRQDLGTAAKEYVIAAHTPQQYADQVVEFCQELQGLKPIYQLINTVGHIFQEMQAHPHMPNIQAVAKEIYTMTDDKA